MTINRLWLVLLGVAALVPLVYLIALLEYLIPSLETLGRPGGISESRYFAIFRIVFATSFLVFVLTFWLVGYFGWFLHKRTSIPRTKKSLWTGLLLVGNILVLPLFWYLFLWSNPGRFGPKSGM